jgi:hypothetical protein
MQHISTSVDIAAPIRRVWSVLMDFAAYPSWNPFILRLLGQPSPGNRLSVTIQPVGGRAMTLSPTVLAATPEFEFRWKGMLLVRGIFDAEHCFRLSATTGTTTHMIHEEFFSGFLVPLAMHGRLKAGTLAGFHAMNQALKARAESGDA